MVVDELFFSQAHKMHQSKPNDLQTTIQTIPFYVLKTPFRRILIHTFFNFIIFYMNIMKSMSKW